MILKKHLEVSYPNEWAFINDLLESTGKHPLALFHSGSIGGANQYVLVYGYTFGTLMREVPVLSSWLKTKLISLGLAKAPVPPLEPMPKELSSTVILNDTGTTFQMVELKDLLNRLFNNEPEAHIQVSGLNVSSDLWTEGSHADDTEYGILYDYVGRGIQELAGEWIMPVSMEAKLIERVAEAKNELTKASAQDRDFQQEAAQYVEAIYRVRNYRFANVLNVNPDNLCPDWLPAAVLAEISRHITNDWTTTPDNKPVLPSGELNHFAENIVEMGPEELRGIPKPPSTIRPEKKLSNFYEAVLDKLEALTGNRK